MYRHPPSGGPKRTRQGVDTESEKEREREIEKSSESFKNKSATDEGLSGERIEKEKQTKTFVRGLSGRGLAKMKVGTTACRSKSGLIKTP